MQNINAIELLSALVFPFSFGKSIRSSGFALRASHLSICEEYGNRLYVKTYSLSRNKGKRAGEA